MAHAKIDKKEGIYGSFNWFANGIYEQYEKYEETITACGGEIKVLQQKIKDLKTEPDLSLKLRIDAADKVINFVHEQMLRYLDFTSIDLQRTQIQEIRNIMSELNSYLIPPDEDSVPEEKSEPLLTKDGDIEWPETALETRSEQAQAQPREAGKFVKKNNRPNPLGKLIEEWRVREGFKSRTAFAEHVGMSITSYNNIAVGKAKNIRLATLQPIKIAYPDLDLHNMSALKRQIEAV